MAYKHDPATFLVNFLALFLGLGFVLSSFSSQAQAQTQATLESPASGDFIQSGVGLIRGWACEASQIEISIDDGPLQAIAYGTDRPDTQVVCGDSNNGFGFTFNWNRIGDGVHNLRAFADGVEFANANFTVTTLGQEFVTGLRAQYTLRNFPSSGASPQVLWSEAHQNFVFARQVSIPASTSTPNNPRAQLESPSQGSHESGIGLIRGWVCEASQITISIDGGPLQVIAYGTDRPDTQETCGDSNNGFGFTFNWNRVGDGVHNLRALVDGVEFANVNFAVATLNQEEFLTGLSSQFKLGDFPATGQVTTAEWSQAQQNFVVSRSTVLPSRLALIALVADRLNPMIVAGRGTSEAGTTGESFGLRAVKRDDGVPTQLAGLTWAQDSSGQAVDLQLSSDGLPSTYTDSSGIEARLSGFNSDNTVTMQFFRASVAQSNPVTVPINNAQLQGLQTMAARVLAAAQSTSAKSDQQWMPEAEKISGQTKVTVLRRFSLGALLVNSYWYSSVATAEILCAVRIAAAQAGIGEVVATDACQAPLLAALLARAATTLRSTAADPPSSGIDSLVQQSLQASADITEAPCDTDTPIGCLEPTSAVLQERQNEAAQTTTLPQEDPIDAILSPPTEVSASDGLFSDHIQITWNPVADATSYRVYRDYLSIGSSLTTSFEDSAVASGLIYSYMIKACNSNGCSSFSNADSGFAQAGQTATYLVSATAGSGGTISPSSQTVDQGANTSFIVTPSNGYQIASVTGCGGSLSGTTYTTGPITANCTVSASFSPISQTTSYQVTATATNFGGIISPDSQTVNQGATTSFTLSLNYGYQIDSISGCGGSLNGSTYTTGPITADCTVTVSFEVATHLVTATAGSGGTISPSSQTVSHGTSISFTVTPSSDNYYPYIDSSNTSCGGSLNWGYPSSIYTTGPITADCTISIAFSFD